MKFCRKAFNVLSANSDKEIKCMFTRSKMVQNIINPQNIIKRENKKVHSKVFTAFLLLFVFPYCFKGNIMKRILNKNETLKCNT